MTVDQGAPRPHGAYVGELFHQMVESVRDYAIFMLDPTGHILTWNSGAERIKGYPASEVIGRHFRLFYPPEAVADRTPERALQIAADDGRCEWEGWRVRKDGTRFWAHVIITRVNAEESGSLLGFVKVTRDLTERKRADDERERLLLAEHEARVTAEAANERLQIIQSMTEAALAYVDQEGVLNAILDRLAAPLRADTMSILLREGDEFVTAAARGLDEAVQRRTRYPPTGTVVGRIAAAAGPLVIEDLAAYDIHAPLMRAKGITSVLGVQLRVEDEVIGVMHLGTVRRREFSTEDQVLFRVVADRVALMIAHARAVEAEQRARADSMVAAARARLRDEFLAVAAHELKTPLTGLRAGVQLALRRLTEPQPQDAEARALLERAVRQADRLNRLVIQLLDASHAEAGGLTLALASADAAALVRDVVEAVAETTGRDVRLDAPATLVARVDPSRFEQVVVNLLDNAIKFSPGDTPIEASLRREGESLVLQVRDHGPGIEPDRRPGLFDRLSGPTDSMEAGLGLGLYISSEIARAHGGDIAADFPADGGSKFRVRLPIDSER